MDEISSINYGSYIDDLKIFSTIQFNSNKMQIFYINICILRALERNIKLICNIEIWFVLFIFCSLRIRICALLIIFSLDIFFFSIAWLLSSLKIVDHQLKIRWGMGDGNKQNYQLSSSAEIRLVIDNFN